MTKNKSKSNATNRFCVSVNISLPEGEMRDSVLRWIALQHFGQERPPEKVPKEFNECLSKLCNARTYEFVFETTADGHWMFVGRKA